MSDAAPGELTCFLAALQFFTRVPVPSWVGHSQAQLQVAIRYFPAVGILVGAIGAAVFLGAGTVLPQRFAVLAGIAATILLTGAMHEDGLADAVDGLGGGYTRERVLAIMQDSQIGTYGACALLLSVMLRLEALAALPPVRIAVAFVAGHAVSRAAVLLIMARLPYARVEESSRARPLVQPPGLATLVVALLFGLLPLGLLGGAGLYVLALVAVVAMVWTAYLRRRLGGYTGDCLGALQQLAELTSYAVVAAVG
jgi:adenosylcobinamide-GDP ribazoletransferase